MLDKPRLPVRRVLGRIPGDIPRSGAANPGKPDATPTVAPERAGADRRMVARARALLEAVTDVRNHGLPVTH